MPLRVLEIGEVHFCEGVGLDHRRDGQDLVGLDSGDEGGYGLPDDDEHTLDGVGVFGGERSSDAGVSEFYLIVAHHHVHAHAAETVSHAFLVEVLHHLELLLKGNSRVVSYVQ